MTTRSNSAQAGPLPEPVTITERLRLSATIDPASIVRLLSEVGLSDFDIATAVGVTERSVRRWRAGDGERAPLLRKWRAVDDLRAVVLILAEEGSLTLEGIVLWLRARNRLLDDQRPLEVLCPGGFDQVRDAALSLVDPHWRSMRDG